MRRIKVQWTGIIGNFRLSGLTVHRFCKSEGIAEQSHRNWIIRAEKVSGSKLDHGFVEVQLTRAPNRLDKAKPSSLDLSGLRHGLIICFPDGTFIDVYPDTDRSILEWVLTLMARQK